MNRLVESEEIRGYKDRADEIMDGIFGFVNQGEYAYDACCYYHDDYMLFCVDIFKKVQDARNRELHNFEELEFVKFDDLHLDYEMIERKNFFEKSEMMIFLANWMMKVSDL